MSPDYLVLEFGIEFAEVSAPAPNTNNEIAMAFGMNERILKFLNIENIKLKLLVAECNEVLDKLCKLLDAFRSLKYCIRKLDCNRSAIHDARIVNCCERLKHT